MSEGKTVLLIDDEVMSNAVHTMMLQAHPHIGQIQEARNGKEALIFLEESIRKGEAFPDIIYLDINMPLMDGFEFLERLNTHPLIDYSKLNIAILSSSVHPKDMTKARNLGIAHFFVKPLSEYHIRQSLKVIKEWDQA